MSELIKYTCPSCGANLSPAPGDKTVSCHFCGSTFSASAITDRYEQLSAEKLAKSTAKYKADLIKYRELRSNTSALADEVTSLSQTPTALPIWAWLIIPLHFLAVVFILITIKFAWDNTAAMTFSFIVFFSAVVVLIAMDIKKKKIKRTAEETNRQLRIKLDMLNKARGELEEFEKGFDIDAVPESYRSFEALDYITNIFKTKQASRLGDAFRLYDKHRHYKTMEELQSRQVQLQERQLEIMDELAAYDFDDTYDDDDFTLHEAVQTFKKLNQDQ